MFFVSLPASVQNKQLMLVWITISRLKSKIVSWKIGKAFLSFYIIFYSPCGKTLQNVYWWGNSTSGLFMFKLPAGNGTTFEAVEHNGALDKDSWERRELDNIQRLKACQETLPKNDGELSPFPSFVLFGRLNPIRMTQPMPSIATNSNKQQCCLFLTVKKYRMEGPSHIEADSERLEG